MENKKLYSIIDSLESSIIKGQSIVLLSSYRTGSTALCRLLSTHFKLLNLDELFHRNNDPATYNDYIKNPCVVKIQPDQIIQSHWNNLTANGYVIGLSRRSLLDQIASFYCCNVTGIWHRYSDCSRQEYEIEWTKHDLEDQCRYIIKMNKEYKKLKQICATEFFYEDICDDLQHSGMKPTVRPSNYQDLLQAIHNCLTLL